MNELTQYPLPQWIAIAFMIAIPLPFVLLIHYVYVESKKLQLKYPFPLVSLFFVAYLGYIALASYLGWFNQVLFPPKVLLLTTFPFAFLLFVLLGKSNLFTSFLEQAALEKLIQLHIFRVIGSFFIFLAFFDALPKTFAYIAGVGDVVAALSSIFVVKAIKNKKSYAKKLSYVWNIFGTVDILFTAIAANVLTKLSIDNGTMGVDSLAFFPFCIIPAFAPPIILFLHWCIFKKLKVF
jgi:hypothetical protein